MDLINGMLVVVVTVALIALATRMLKLESRSPSRGTKETYTQIGVNRTYKVPSDVQVPDGTPVKSPLAKHLTGVADASTPPMAPGEPMAWSKAEIERVADRVVARINAKSPGLGLVLVSFDNVKKTVDAYKTVRYEVDVQVHSMTKMYSSRLTAKVDVSSSGKEYLREVSLHNARLDDSKIESVSSISGLETYAAFEPAVRY